MIDSDGKSIAKPLNEKTFSSDIGFSESVAIIKNVFGINVVREDMAIEKG